MLADFGELVIRHVQGKSNRADSLSQVPIGKATSPVTDVLPDGELSVVLAIESTFL